MENIFFFNMFVPPTKFGDPELLRARTPAQSNAGRNDSILSRSESILWIFRHFQGEKGLCDLLLIGLASAAIRAFRLGQDTWVSG